MDEDVAYYAMEEEEGRGRYLVASQQLASGLCILTCPAVAKSLSDAFLETRCSSCCHPTPERCCSGCSKIKFCKDCSSDSNIDVVLHRYECLSFKQLFQSSEFKIEESRTLRLMLRLLLLKSVEEGRISLQDMSKDGDDLQEGLSIPSYQDAVDCLWSNSQAMPEELLSRFSNIVKQARYLLPSECRINVEEGVELLAKAYCNAHELINPDGSDEDMGFGLFPLACFFNHSCIPNCTWCVRDDGQLEVRTTRGVEEGEELSISYCDLYEDGRSRRATLQKNFFFTCECGRCQLEPRWRLREQKLSAWKCREECAGMMLPGALLDRQEKKPKKRKRGKMSRREEEEEEEEGGEKSRGIGGQKLICSSCGGCKELDHVRLEEETAKKILEASEAMARGKVEESTRILEELKEQISDLHETHSNSLKCLRIKLRLAIKQKKDNEIVAISSKLQALTRELFEEEELSADLRSGHLAWQQAQASWRILQARKEKSAGMEGEERKEEERKEEEQIKKQARAALRIFATCLGSQHWFVRDVKEEVKRLTS